MTSEFYKAAAVTIAKDRLVEDVAALGIEGWPRPVNRRATENKMANELDDIFGLFQWIDEKGLYDRLPTYVSCNPEQLPLIRLEKGDITVVLNKMDHMETLIESIRMDMLDNKRAIDMLTKAKNSALHSPLRRVGLVTDQRAASGGGSGSGGTTGVEQRAIGGGGAGSWGSKGSDQRAADGGGAGSEVNTGTMTATYTQAARAESSHAGSWADCVAAEHESAAANGAQRSMDNDGYTTVYNNRHNAKRARGSDSPPSAAASNRPTARAPRVKAIGRMAASNQAVKAAPPKPPKSVFHLSNVDKSIDEFKMTDFLQKEMNVTVLTIFPVNPTKWNENSAAFRVCIPTADTQKLLDTTLLPDGIIVREWFFKGKHPEPKGRQRDGSPTRSARISTRESPPNSPRINNPRDWPPIYPPQAIVSALASTDTHAGGAKCPPLALNQSSMHAPCETSVNEATGQLGAVPSTCTSLGGAGGDSAAISMDTDRSDHIMEGVNGVGVDGSGGRAVDGAARSGAAATRATAGIINGADSNIGQNEPPLSDILQEANKILHGE